MLAILGFATIGVFLVLVVATRTPVIAALILTPLAAAVAGGFSDQAGAFAVDGLRTVAPVAAMIMFAVLYFGLMIDVGLFTPLIERLLGLVRGDPIRLCLTTAALAMLVALDGDGATTFLISVTALLPVYRRMGINPLVLPAIVALAAGVMNLLPWGGPTARAMSVLRAGVDQIFVPVLPAMAIGILWVFFVAWWIGRAERGDWRLSRSQFLECDLKRRSRRSRPSRRAARSSISTPFSRHWSSCFSCRACLPTG